MKQQLRINEFTILKLTDFTNNRPTLADFCLLASIVTSTNAELSKKVLFMCGNRFFRSNDVSRKERIHMLNGFYEGSIKQGYILKPCVLPHQQAWAYYFFLLEFDQDPICTEIIHFRNGFSDLMDQGVKMNISRQKDDRLTVNKMRDKRVLKLYTKNAVKWQDAFWFFYPFIKTSSDLNIKPIHDDLTILSKKWELKPRDEIEWPPDFLDYYWTKLKVVNREKTDTA